jgi:hypothetical protein
MLTDNVDLLAREADLIDDGLVRYLFFCTLLFVLSGAACHSPKEADELSQDQALQIARQELSFEPVSYEVEEVIEDGQALWRVTFRGKPILPGRPMFHILIVSLDRKTGAVVGLSRN